MCPDETSEYGSTWGAPVPGLVKRADAGGWGGEGIAESVAPPERRSGEPDGVSLRTWPLADPVRGVTPPGSLAFELEAS